MKKVYFLLLTILFAASAIAQSSANYSFTTVATGSLTDMSAGTTQLVAASQDDAASPVTNIGFDFWFMGTRYTQFSANSNGYVRLGGTAVATAQYTLGTAGTALIASLGSDEMSSSTGKVHYKVIGSAPNRTLVIEFLKMTIIYDGLAVLTDGTSQVRLSETTNLVELAYGSMNRNSSTGFLGGMDPQWIGFSTNSTNNTYATITNASNAVATTGAITSNQNTLGAVMPNLNSAADGSRRLYDFTPQGANAPSGLNFTAVNAVGMTLNWTDNSADELGFAIYRSTDGVNYTFISQTAANAVSSVQSGLGAGVNYFWRVYAVREALSTALSGSQSTTPPGNIVSTGSGNWSSTVPNAPWPGGILPTAGDNVTIADGHTITIDITTAVCLNLQVGQGASGVLQYISTPASTLTTGGNVTITANGTFTAGSGALTTHVLSVGADLTNNGTLDFFTTAGTGITFTGAANNTFGGTGATTDIRTLTINKGTSNANVLELNPSNLTVQGTVTDGTPMAFLTLTNGTLKVSGTYTIAGRVFTAAAYSIGATAGFWLNNPNFTVSGQNGSPSTAGLLRISQGTLNIGTSTGNSMAFTANSTIIVEGGAVNAAGRFGVTAAATAISYTQTAGTVTVCTVGNTSTTLASFDLGTSLTSSLNISGGTIICQLANTAASGPRDYRNSGGAGIATITGGTLQLGNAASGAAKTFNIGSVVPNLVIDNTSAGHTATFLAPVNWNDISLNITINTGTTLNIVNNVFLFNGTTITNNGTLTANGASCRFITFKPNTNMTYTGTGTVTAPMTSLELQNDLNFTFDPAVSNVVANRIIIFTGGFVNANKLTLGNGGATTGIVQIGNTTTPTNAGIFDVAPAFNLGTGGQVISYLRTTNTRVTGPEINPTRTLTSMTYDDNDPAHTLAVTGGDITLSATGAALTMTNGRIVTGANNVILSSGTATVTRTAGYVDGNFRKTFAAAASKNFEVGTANGYSPATINVTAGTFPAPVTAKAVQGPQPVLNPAASLQRYWTLTASGITADLSFNYLAADVNGTEANYKVVKVESGVPTVFPASTVNTVTHVGAVTGISSFSDWTLAEPCTGAVGGTATGNAVFCGPGTPTITATGYSAGAGIGYQWQSSNDNFVANIVDIPGQTNPASLTTGLVSSTTYYRLKVTCPIGTATDFSNIITVTITTPPSATISYTGSPYCSNAGTANVTQTGTGGGTYSSTAGLTLNAATGAVTLGTSTPGTYTVTYTIAASGGCPLFTTTASITITAAPGATIAYAGSPYCTNAGTATVTQTGTTGGTYSATPAGLTLNAATGAITLATSAANTYTVTYTIAASGGCPIFTATASVTITNCGGIVTVTASAGVPGPSPYNTVKEAFDAINAGTHQGAIIVNINNSTSEGATPAVLNSSGTGSSVYTSVLIRPTADALTVAGGTIPTTRGVIEFNGADNVTLDGDNPNSAGTNRNLTITATGTTASTTLIWIKTPSAADGCTNNTIRNCNITGQNQINTTIGILSGGTAFGTIALAPNSNTTITNNAFSRSQNGIFWFGFGTTPFDANLVIDNNTFGSTIAADKHIFRGLITQNTSNFTISNNTINGVASTTTSASIMHGIQIAGAVLGGNIFNNRISDIKQNNTGGFGADGIMLATSTTASNINVYNNFISDVTGFGFNGFGNNDNGNGISLAGGGGFNIYHNTVLMNTNQGSTAGNPAAILVTTGVTTNASLNVRNNIFVNTQTNGGNRYAIACAAPVSRFATINYNDYYSSGANLGNITGTNVATLAALQTATTQDANSVNALPVFVSATDLHLSATGNCPLDGTATPIATVPNDIDNTVRSATTPDIGADEFVSAPRTATIAYPGSPYCSNAGTATVTQTGTTGGTYSATPAGLTINATTGAVTLATSTAGTYTVTYTLAALGSCPAFTTSTTITITAAASATISYAGTPYCSTDLTAPVTRTGTAGGTYSSTAGLTINATTGTVTPNTSTPGTYTVTYTIAAGGGCGAFSTTTTITITQAPNAIIFYLNNPYCSNSGTATVSQFGTTGGTYSAAPAGLTINATTGAITLGTSTPGTYTVTYTMAASGGCGITITTTTITITPAPSATISYTGSPYCSNAGTATVTRTGTAGGTYSSTPGLTLNATTGAVTLGTSTPGTYVVTYTVAASGGCAVFTTTTSITITALPAATISYAGSPYCSNAGTATVTRTGTAGGTYSSTAGLVINASTGDVNLATSTAGTYTVTYTIAAGGGCPVVTTTTTITITTLPAATITYTGNPFCQNAGTATVTRTGTAGGTYSAAPAGLTINATTGTVTLGTSTPGTYTVTYTIAAGGGCGVVTATTSITVSSLSVAATAATASSTSLCGPTAITLSVTGGSLGTGATWRWYTGSCGGTLVGTGATLNITPTATTTYFVRAEGTCNTTTCVSVTVTVNIQPTIALTATLPTSLMPGQTSTLTATVTPANATNTTTWYRDGNVVPGATGLSLVVGVDALGLYTVRTTTTSGCTALSNAVLIKDSASGKMWLYPNPNSGQFQVRYYSNAQQLGFVRHIIMYNQAGQKVFDQTYPITGPYSNMNVDARILPSGVYVLQLTDAFRNEILATDRVVIVR